MGMFSRKKCELYILTEEERGMIYAFWRNGWSAETRRQAGIPERPYNIIMDKSIVKALEKGTVDEEQLNYIVEVLKMDFQAHPSDTDEKVIIEKLMNLVL